MNALIRGCDTVLGTHRPLVGQAWLVPVSTLRLGDRDEMASRCRPGAPGSRSIASPKARAGTPWDGMDTPRDGMDRGPARLPGMAVLGVDDVIAASASFSEFHALIEMI